MHHCPVRDWLGALEYRLIALGEPAASDVTSQDLTLMYRDIWFGDHRDESICGVTMGQPFVPIVPGESDLVDRLPSDPQGLHPLRHECSRLGPSTFRIDRVPIAILDLMLGGEFGRDLCEGLGLRFGQAPQHPCPPASGMAFGQAVSGEDVWVVRVGESMVPLPGALPEEGHRIPLSTFVEEGLDWALPRLVV